MLVYLYNLYMIKNKFNAVLFKIITNRKFYLLNKYSDIIISLNKLAISKPNLLQSVLTYHFM